MPFWQRNGNEKSPFPDLLQEGGNFLLAEAVHDNIRRGRGAVMVRIGPTLGENVGNHSAALHNAARNGFGHGALTAESSNQARNEQRHSLRLVSLRTIRSLFINTSYFVGL